MLQYDTSTPETSTSVIPPSSVIFQNPIMGKKNLLTFFTVKTSSFELHFWTTATHLKLLFSPICIFSHTPPVPRFSTDLFKIKSWIKERAFACHDVYIDTSYVLFQKKINPSHFRCVDGRKNILSTRYKTPLSLWVNLFNNSSLQKPNRQLFSLVNSHCAEHSIFDCTFNLREPSQILPPWKFRWNPLNRLYRFIIRMHITWDSPNQLKPSSYTLSLVSSVQSGDSPCFGI